MVEQDIFGKIMSGGEMATRMVWSPHDHNKECRGVVEAQRVSRQPTLHVQTTQKKNEHETTRKRQKQTNLQVLKKCTKTKKRENNIKNSEKKQQKRTRRQNK